MPEGKAIIYQTGLHHGGEVIAKLIGMRSVPETVILMVDAASANTSKLKPDAKVTVANCNSHSFRKFKDAKGNFPKAAAFFLDLYAQIFKTDEKAKSLTPEARLALHQLESEPRMEEMQKRILKDFKDKVVEPNSELGKIYKYFLNHYPKLIRFCTDVGAPVCNNLSERVLKVFIRQRRNSLFFKNDIGAKVSDILSSVLVTAHLNGTNPVKYMEHLLIHRADVSREPDAWLPWNYLKRYPESSTAPTS